MTTVVKHTGNPRFKTRVKKPGYEVFMTLDLKTVLDKLVEPDPTSDQNRHNKEKHVFHPMTAKISIQSHRLWMYKTKGTDCVRCDRKGVEWRIEANGGAPHLNLYCADGVMMTKDHIQAKSKGGINHVDNYQPMCAPCNRNKSDT